MSFIDMGEDLDQDLEEKPVPEGLYDVRITSVNEHTSKKEDGSESKSIRCLIRVESDDHPDAATIFHYVALPGPNDDEAKKKTKLRMAKRFLSMFQIPWTGGQINLEDFQDRTARVQIGLEKDNQGENRNILKLPRVEGESPAASSTTRRRR